MKGEAEVNNKTTKRVNKETWIGQKSKKREVIRGEERGRKEIGEVRRDKGISLVKETRPKTFA